MVIKPSTNEVRSWILQTIKHSCRVEFFYEHLDVGIRDPQRPHDLDGKGSKLSWPVIEGLSMQYRSHNHDFFEKYVLPSIECHQINQYHHQMFNKPNDHADTDAMKAGAVDAICSQLENRFYQGGAHDYEEIREIIKVNDPKKVKWLWIMYSRMKKHEQPDCSVIKDIYGFPNIGLSRKTYDSIVEHVDSAIDMLREKHNYQDL